MLEKLATVRAWPLRGVLVLVVAFVLLQFDSTFAGHLNPCTVSGSNPTIHEGDDTANHCTGGSGADSEYGYGADDQLNGGGDRDKLRGATGDDLLFDDLAGNDNDSTCDGNGFDVVDVDDGDIRDDAHFVEGDGYNDPLDRDAGDEANTYSGSCPIPSP